MHAHHRGSVWRAVQNFRESDIPMLERIVVAGRNVWLRVVLRQACCGHDGEPGC
jgi:hypothetical protein